jgi:hypothetical protein
MAISPKQFIATSEFHQKNLQHLLEQYIELPEAPGILAAMLYIQQSINAARLAAEEDKKNATKKEENDNSSK